MSFSCICIQECLHVCISVTSKICSILSCQAACGRSQQGLGREIQDPDEDQSIGHPSHRSHEPKLQLLPTCRAARTCSWAALTNTRAAKSPSVWWALGNFLGGKEKKDPFPCPAPWQARGETQPCLLAWLLRVPQALGSTGAPSSPGLDAPAEDLPLQRCSQPLVQVLQSWLPGSTRVLFPMTSRASSPPTRTTSPTSQLYPGWRDTAAEHGSPKWTELAPRRPLHRGEFIPNAAVLGRDQR